MSAVVGVVPNFSEGRRREVIDAIVDALAVEGARVVFAEADADHNRLDATVLGDPHAVRRSALAGAAAAVERIDMFTHTGGHPRMGAVDVVPFMPVRDVTMSACVDLARSVGEELAEGLDLPVYLYGEAATVAERRSLADVRKGEFEGLREAVARGDRLPDLGPPEIGRAGATAVGARKPLIAFNVYLTGNDEAAVKEIARTIRESSGGLPALRAIGFEAAERGYVTVSMNLLDFEVTGIRDAFDAVAVEAAARALEIVDSEIVGLVPASAASPEVLTHARVAGFDPERQVLERLLEDDRTAVLGSPGTEAPRTEPRKEGAP